MYQYSYARALMHPQYRCVSFGLLHLATSSLFILKYRILDYHGPFTASQPSKLPLVRMISSLHPVSPPTPRSTPAIISCWSPRPYLPFHLTNQQREMPVPRLRWRVEGLHSDPLPPSLTCLWSMIRQLESLHCLLSRLRLLSKDERYFASQTAQQDWLPHL
jgi:hypothetical protein